MQRLILPVCLALNLEQSEIMCDGNLFLHCCATSRIELIISPKYVKVCCEYRCVLLCVDMRVHKCVWGGGLCWCIYICVGCVCALMYACMCGLCVLVYVCVYMN